MRQSGLFAAEVTKLAPKKNTLTDKPRGYIWMEHKDVIPVAAVVPPVVPDP